MLHFNRLRLSGFKSFVDATELLIEPGLTGIVGPNGCGKSNVVEALRWVMGETSAKQMRGGEMDDVIFGGTQDRPARNLAEVQIFLDNRERNAAPQFNDGDEIEVVRRIERGQGSAYRINGRDMRARDVQLLFADAATGARSTALVSQGRISSLINAKPTDRRALLEEAAGITGLHSRRHEAELRLRAAEANLERLDDVLQTMEGQLQGLKKQARQASRYRNLSDHIRRSEAILLHLRWNGALGDLEVAASLLRGIEQLVAELTGRVAACSTEEAEASLALPPLRQVEADAAAELHRYAVARDALDTEERRVIEAQRVVETRLVQIAADTAREQGLLADATAAMGRLEEERAGLIAAQEQEIEAVEAARTSLDSANGDAAKEENALNAVVRDLAAGEARQSSFERLIAEHEGRAARLTQRQRELDEERIRIEAESGISTALEEAKRAVEQAEALARSTREAAQAAEDIRASAQSDETAAREALEEPEAVRSRLAAEESALAGLLASDSSEIWPPLIDAVTVEAGFEAALGAALGDDLSAPLDEGAPLHWRALPPLIYPLPLPQGCEPLSNFVRGPVVLARRLSQTGVVPDVETGRALSARLVQGQRLVTKDGALWRWDGFTMAAGAPTAATKRLSQRNRLEDVRSALVVANEAVEVARSGVIEAQDRAREAVVTQQKRRDASR